jgi:hypothetical protein
MVEMTCCSDVHKRALGIEEIANLRLLIESARTTAEYASDIAEVILDLNVESILNWES